MKTAYKTATQKIACLQHQKRNVKLQKETSVAFFTHVKNVILGSGQYEADWPGECMACWKLWTLLFVWDNISV